MLPLPGELLPRVGQGGAVPISRDSRTSLTVFRWLFVPIGWFLTTDDGGRCRRPRRSRVELAQGHVVLVPPASALGHAFLTAGNRHSGDPEMYGVKEVPVGEIEGLPIPTTEGDVRGLRLTTDDAHELLALWIQNPDAPRAAIDEVIERPELWLSHACNSATGPCLLRVIRDETEPSAQRPVYPQQRPGSFVPIVHSPRQLARRPGPARGGLHQEPAQLACKLPRGNCG